MHITLPQKNNIFWLLTIIFLSGVPADIRDKVPNGNCAGYVCAYENICIPSSYVCDYEYDCYYGDDETYCKKDNNHESAEKTIEVPQDKLSEVSKKSQILRSRHSLKGSQEKKPSSRGYCYAGEYDCGYDDYCIPTYYVCDGYFDCYYGADESNCFHYGYQKEQVSEKSQKTLLSQSLKEDGGQNKTTRNGYCGWGQYDCGYDDICVPNWYVCDGWVDCIYGEDEANC